MSQQEYFIPFTHGILLKWSFLKDKILIPSKLAFIKSIDQPLKFVPIIAEGKIPLLIPQIVGRRGKIS